MRLKLFLAAAICTTAASWSPVARADGLLDDQLGPKPAADAAKPADTADKSKPEAGKPDAASATGEVLPKAADPAAPGGRQITSPDAVRKVDDEELVKQLTKPGEDKPDANAIAARAKEMVSRMDTTAKHLSGRDPGEVTQETEQRIIQDLDVMIAILKQTQGGGQPQDPSQQQQQPGQSRQQGQGSGQSMGGTTAATDDNLRGGGAATPPGGDMRDKNVANWGGLPPRDRDEISHGANEEYLSSYRELIDRYYQALAETAKTKNR
jgi:hypothetical protein